jgi:hypothetical protein
MQAGRQTVRQAGVQAERCLAQDILDQDILDEAVSAHLAEAHGGSEVVVPLPTLGKNDGVQSVVRTVQIQSCCLPLQTLPCWVLRCL